MRKGQSDFIKTWAGQLGASVSSVNVMSARRHAGKDGRETEKWCRHSHKVIGDLTERSLFLSRHFGVILVHEAPVTSVPSQGCM